MNNTKHIGKFNKNDYCYLIGLLLILIILFIVWQAIFSQTGNTCVVMWNNKEIWSGSLKDEVVLEIQNNNIKVVKNWNEDSIDKLTTNILVIKEGKADVVWGRCPDKVCVNMKAISNIGESIVCMPERVVVTIR